MTLILFSSKKVCMDSRLKRSFVTTKFNIFPWKRNSLTSFLGKTFFFFHLHKWEIFPCLSTPIVYTLQKLINKLLNEQNEYFSLNQESSRILISHWIILGLYSSNEKSVNLTAQGRNKVRFEYYLKVFSSAHFPNYEYAENRQQITQIKQLKKSLFRLRGICVEGGGGYASWTLHTEFLKSLFTIQSILMIVRCTMHVARCTMHDARCAMRCVSNSTRIDYYEVDYLWSTQKQLNRLKLFRVIKG